MPHEGGQHRAFVKHQLKQSIELLGFKWLSTSGFVLLEHFNTCSDDP